MEYFGHLAITFLVNAFGSFLGSWVGFSVLTWRDYKQDVAFEPEESPPAKEPVERPNWGDSPFGAPPAPNAEELKIHRKKWVNAEANAVQKDREMDRRERGSWNGTDKIK